MSAEPSELAAALAVAVERAFESAQLPWLRRLVDTPSHTLAPSDVEAAASIVDALASELGLDVERSADPEGRFADHRIYATPLTGPRDRGLALIGHIDTVFPRELGFLTFERDPSAPDTLRGPGVLDMKSGLSVIFFALRALREVAPERWASLRLRVVMNSDEEVGSPSSGPLFERLAPLITSAMVFEAGRDEDRVITARKGLATFEVVAHGRAAHAGNDHQAGVNAIHALALIIPQIEALTDYDRGVTLNVGLVKGGTAKNTVPSEATCVVDARFSRQADAEATARALRDLCEAPFERLGGAPQRLRSARFELHGGVARPPMEPTAASQALRTRYERHAASAGLRIGEAPLQGGGSDANILAALGVPCIDGLGPYGQHYHRVQEWSSAVSLQRRTLALAAFLADVATTAV